MLSQFLACFLFPRDPRRSIELGHVGIGCESGCFLSCQGAKEQGLDNVPTASAEAGAPCTVLATVSSVGMHRGSSRLSPSLCVAELKKEPRRHRRTVHIASARSRENVGLGLSFFIAVEGISWRHEAQLCRLCP